MAIGAQFGNINRYTRYPFADNVDLTCRVAGSDFSQIVSTAILPESFLTAFRLVYVGVSNVKSVGLVAVVFEHGNFSFLFDVLDDSGAPIKFLFQSRQIADNREYPYLGHVSVSTGNSPNGMIDTVFRISDFDFSNLMSIYIKADTNVLMETVCSGLGMSTSDVHKFAVFCNIKMADGLVLSMRAPHVMSMLDDTGAPIRDQDTVFLVPGYNTKFDIVPGSNTVIISAIRGAGAGFPEDQSGLAPSSLFSSNKLRRINGVSAGPFGDITVTGGHGVVVKPIPDTNILNVYSNLETKDALKCKANRV